MWAGKLQHACMNTSYAADVLIDNQCIQWAPAFLSAYLNKPRPPGVHQHQAKVILSLGAAPHTSQAVSHLQSVRMSLSNKLNLDKVDVKGKRVIMRWVWNVKLCRKVIIACPSSTRYARCLFCKSYLNLLPSIKTERFSSILDNRKCMCCVTIKDTCGMAWAPTHRVDFH